MRKSVSAVFVVIFFLIIIFLMAQDFTYVGVNKCKICHKAEKRGNQYEKWLEGPHAKSYKALSSVKAAEIAKKAGLTTSPAESSECLQCHSPLASAGFEEEGVSCEACHGPGSEYKKLSVMKDKNLALQKGLIDLSTEEKKVTICTKCHRADNKYHEMKPFNLKEFWEKIIHPKPSE